MVRYNFKWAFRKTTISIVGTLVALTLLLRFNHDSNYHHTRSTQNERRIYNKPRSVIAVINTPKMGTSSLSQSFIDFWKCTNGMGYPSYLTYNCPDERKVVQAHDADAGAKAIKQHQQQYPGGQCLIVTAIRSPATWLPSLYYQHSQICKASLMSKDNVLQDYMRFLGDVNLIRESTESCLPELMKEFNGGSLKKQAKIMDYSGGYSVLGPASSESAFAGCELLFLRMEQSDRWPGFIKKLVPDSNYYRGESHISQCPELSDHIKMLQDYELTKEEKMVLYNSGSAIISDWFDSYGYIEGSPQIKESSYSTPESIIAVINTPKTGITSLTQNFIRSWKCDNVFEDPSYVTYGCPDDRLVVRAQQFDASAQVVQQHRLDHPEGKCLIVTSIRHPSAWLPSLYIQKRRICGNTSMTKDDMLQDYKQVLGSQHLLRPSAESCLSKLMKEFNGGSLKEQAKIMDQNGGYSILGASSESVFAGCELLFLRMEQSDQWPEIIQMVVPESDYTRVESRASQCPELADHVKMLHDYELTIDEKKHLYTNGGDLMADWFDAYEYINEWEALTDH